MAGDWIKFEVATSDKPEVWAIADVLGIDPDAVVGKLLRVWAWFDQHTTDGNAPSVTSALLDRCVGVTGFCKAVTLAGWMVDDGNTISLPNFDTHNGETAKKRCQTAKRVAKHKKSNASSNAKVTQAALPTALPKEDTREDIRKDNLLGEHIGSPSAHGDDKSRGTRLPNDWALSNEWLADAMSLGADRVMAYAEAEKFKDYWHSVAGAKGRRADWLATWKNWIRRALENKTRGKIYADSKYALAEHRASRDFGRVAAQDF